MFFVAFRCCGSTLEVYSDCSDFCYIANFAWVDYLEKEVAWPGWVGFFNRDPTVVMFAFVLASI